MKAKLTLLCAIFIMIFACAKEEVTAEKSEAEVYYSSDAASGDLSISVTETGSWSVASSQSWCTIPSEYSSGSGATTITVSLEQNTTGEARIATVTITGDNSITYAYVTQSSVYEYSGSYEVAAEGGVITILVDDEGAWSAQSNSSWSPIPSEYSSGDGEATFDVQVSANSTAARTATIIITTESSITTYSVNQAAADGYVAGERELTLIFHTLYDDSSDEKQYISQARITEILDYLNSTYNQANNNFDINFVLATTDPDGNLLPEAGIERVSVSSATIDVEAFMTDMENSMVADHLWDCDKYVNLYTYYFEGDIALGISFLPYTMTTNSIDGLVVSDHYLLNEPTYLHGVHLNCNYSDIDTEEGDSPFGNANYDCDFKVSVAHEVGHYLGLIHPFTESGEASCSGDDYCDDTPNYDRDLYTNNLYSMVITSVDQLFVRTACSGEEFVATNIMDYGYNWYYGFSADQNTRVNRVLDEAILVPGYRALASKVTKSSVGERPVPKYLICGDSGANHICDNVNCLHNH